MDIQGTNHSELDGVVGLETESDDMDPHDHEHVWSAGMPVFEKGKLKVTITCLTCGGEMNGHVPLYDRKDSLPTIKPAADGHYHCWHSTGTVYESFPPKYPKVCCHCGEERVFQEGEFSPITKTHGTKHQPNRFERLQHAFREVRDPNLY